MGWLFSYDPGFGRKQLLEDLRSPRRFGEHIKLLQSSAVGNHHWYLAKTTKPDGSEVTWIGLDLMQGGGRNQGWGYKDMSESMGPYYYDCPITYLDKASPAKGCAIEWRAKVRSYHEAKKKRPKPVAGLVVEYGGHQYKLLGPHWSGARKGWNVVRVSDGCGFRMGARQLAQAKVVEEEEEA